ncbi:putative SP-containing membrane protein [Vairimorpha necatrix]|uniref:SP-containing membrane protein n=1 Tax=Vairimorpha necatrix TaxID=6039 RepID=A0AAX4JFT2_9MICR
MLSIIKADEYMDDLLSSMINKNLTLEVTCASLKNSFTDEDMSFETIRGYIVFFWDTIINHDIFRNMTESNNSIFSFRELRSLLRDAYFKKIKSVFRKTKWNPYLLDNFSFSEKKFIYDMVNLTLEYYNILRLCYKDRINNANSTMDCVEEIIRENTCFIRNNETDQFPTFVVKMCTGQLYQYISCYKHDWMDYALQYLKHNQNLLSKAECINDNYDFKKITSEITNEPLSYIMEDRSYYNERYVFIILSGLIICLILTFIGYMFHNKKKRTNKNFI